MAEKKKVALIGVSSLLLVAMVVGAVVGIRGTGKSSTGADASSAPQVSTSNKAVESICQPTEFKETCIEKLSTAAGNETDPQVLVKVGFQVTVDEIQSAIRNSSTLKELAKDPRSSQALQNCHELMEYAIDDLRASFERLGAFDMNNLDDYVADIKVWLSAAITYQTTCLDGFENTTSAAGEEMKKFLKVSGELTRNGLAIVTEFSTALSTALSSVNITGFNRRLLSDDDDIPAWVNPAQRRLLQAAPGEVKPNVVVAKDGTGKYKTINEALKDVPLNGTKPFVIHVKAGVYVEHVTIGKWMTHVTLVGDGATKTKITGSNNYVDGATQYKTDTVAVLGKNFMAKDIGFENSAGFAKREAVAIRVQSDKSVFYRCQFDGYQNTVYAHVHRQFYRDCTLTGTRDFIFGNAAAVFQNCNLVVRTPSLDDDEPECFIIAQGREDARGPTGTVIQNCTISADPKLVPELSRVRTFLARPWKPFSRTIIMQSQIDKLVDPAGWGDWMGTYATDTCFFAEFENRGPGANTARRVTWPGIKKITPAEAAGFTVEKFLEAREPWVKPTGVPVIPGMIPA